MITFDVSLQPVSGLVTVSIFHKQTFTM